MDKDCEIYKADVYTTNLKYNNLLEVPAVLYLDVQKVVIPSCPENKANIIACLEFVFKNFLNLKKLKFVLVRGTRLSKIDGKVYSLDGNVSFLDGIVTDKIALLQKLVSIRTCIANYNIAGQRFYGRTSNSMFSYESKTYVCMNDMIIFNYGDGLTIPQNITKLNIVGLRSCSEKMLSNLEVELTNLTISMYIDEINLLKSLNLPPTTQKVNILVNVENVDYIIKYKTLEESEVHNITKNKIKNIIKLPHNCELNISIKTFMGDNTSMSDDEDFNSFNDPSICDN